MNNFTSKPFDIAFCVNDNYVPHILVTIHSILVNNKNNYIRFHIFTDFISHKNIKKLKSIIKKTNSSLEINYVDDTCLKNLYFGRYTIYAWYRILIPQILKDIDIILYLDADTVVHGDLSDLFQMDYNDISVAAVQDDWTDEKNPFKFEKLGLNNKEKYFCSGIMIMNLDYWRKQEISKKIIDWAKMNKNILECPDQDAINHICQETTILLPLKYGVTRHMFQNVNWLRDKKVELIQAFTNPIIIHYCVTSPWYYECNHPLIHIWRKYNMNLSISNRNILMFQYRISFKETLKTKIWFLFNPHKKNVEFQHTKKSLCL